MGDHIVAKHALLGFLSFGPATGYELKHAFENSIQHFWSADLSQIYRTLESLREEGLVTMRIEHQESKPPKHIYSLTESGRAELLRWLHEPTVELPTVRNPFSDESLLRRAAAQRSSAWASPSLR
jgi:PadR family transcriptional regulator, regulatory protein AphA